MVYLRGVLPLSTKLVSSINEYFECHEALEYEEWPYMLSDILEETIGYRELCQALLQMHEDILVPLKEKEDQARLTIKELKHLQREIERKRKELEEKAGSERSWAVGLAFVPIVNMIYTSTIWFINIPVYPLGSSDSLLGVAPSRNEHND